MHYERQFDVRGDTADVLRPMDATSAATSRSSSLNDRSAMSGLPPTRYQPGGRLAAPSSTRSRRRQRLRTTAGPMARPIANATCGGEMLGS